MASEPYDDQNIFAKILRKEIPSYMIFETEHAYAFLDAFPMAKGHSLLIPKASGFRTTMDFDEETAANVLKELPKLCRMVKEATGCDGVNIIQNNDATAGQIVFHAHFHVVPRWDNDNLFKAPPSSSSMIDGEEAKELLMKMQK